MRVTSVLRKLMGIEALFVEGVTWRTDGDLSVAVRPRWRKPRCAGCGRRMSGHYDRQLRHWRHLSLGRTTVWLTYSRRRVQCPECGTRVERVPWSEGTGRFTAPFEELVAYLAQVTDKTKVAELTGVAWATVGSIVERVVSRRLDPGRLAGLRRIGVDEFSYRKRHRYLTVVVDHDRRRVVWAGEGRSAEVLGSFFEQLGAEGRAAIETVTIDMAGGYKKAIQQWLPQTEIVYDRFHVQRLASDAVDEVRRSIVRELGGPSSAGKVKRSRFVLLKNAEDLSPEQRGRLADVQATNRRLYRAYLLKETLRRALQYRQPWRARKALRAWLSWASRSKLAPFVKLARTIRKHFDGIMAYIETRLTNGLVEGTNNKLRMVARRAYGFHSPRALTSMLFLVCGGIELNPPLPTRS